MKGPAGWWVAGMSDLAIENRKVFGKEASTAIDHEVLPERGDHPVATQR